MNRYCKLLLMGGIVLALTMPASAITLVTGENNFKIINRDNGTVYYNIGPKGAWIGDPVNVANGVAILDAYLPKDIAVGRRFASEDSWGIAHTTDIHDVDGTVIWQSLSANTELTWMFHSATDYYAEVSDGVGSVHTDSVGLIAELWEEPKLGGTPINMTKGSPWRTGLSTYTGATEGTMLLQLTSAPGFLHVAGDFGGPLAEFESIFNAVSNSSSGTAYFDVTGGTMASFFDTNTITSTAGQINGVPNADAWIQFTATAASDGPNPSKLGGIPPYDWLVTSEDPVRTNVIPEPMTMAGLLLGVGCLGRYIRKRR